MKRKLNKSLFINAGVILSGLLLVGCDSKQTEFEKITNNALQSADPFMTMDKYYSENEFNFNGCDSIFRITSNAFCNQIFESNIKVMKASLDKDSIPALLYLFNDYDLSHWIAPRDLKRSDVELYLHNLISLARKLQINKKYSEVFMTAARELQNGRYITQDTMGAIDFYLKAWMAGNREAATKLADVYNFLNDPSRAYFWSIRSMEILLDTDQLKDISPEEKIRIQKKAADLSIVNY